MATDKTIDNDDKKDALMRDFTESIRAGQKAFMRGAEESFANRLKSDAYWAEEFVSRVAAKGTGQLDFLNSAEWIRTEAGKELIIRDRVLAVRPDERRKLEQTDSEFRKVMGSGTKIDLFERCRIDPIKERPAMFERDIKEKQYYKIDYLIDEIGVEEKQNNAYRLSSTGIILYYVYWATAPAQGLLRRGNGY